jgi:glucose/arabinose dehydrogenase
MNKNAKIFIAGFLISSTLLYCNKDEDFWDSMIPETDEQPTASQVSGFVFRPALEPATDANIAQLKVPAGFAVKKFADNLGKPRIIAANTNGDIYTTDREAGIVMLLQDTNNDGVAEIKKTVATIKQAHGLAIMNAKLFIVAVNELYVANIQADGSLSEPTLLIDRLPDGGQHPNRTLAFGPDGKMYISIGSTCNSCPEPNSLNGTILQANPDGSGRRIFSRGLRNTIGFSWHPQTKEFWGMDHGIDWLGDDEQKEELNLIKDNANYGWPYIFGDGKYNPGSRPQGDTTYKQYLDLSTLPTLLYEAHSAPMQMVFYTGTMFGSDYQNDAFVAMRGSWNRSQPSGYKVVRIKFENGKPVRMDDFLTGFLVDNNRAHFARLVGVAIHKDGSLLVSDDTNGIIYRISKI